MFIIKSVGLVIGVCVGLYLTYSLKVYLGINLDIAGDEHFPSVIERKSHGVIKCRWFPNHHHCK